MDCKIIRVEQNSDEWLNLRRCRITCSRLGDVMAKPTTKRYQEYQRQIAQELCGIEHPEKDAPWFAHGKELEPRAIGAYQFRYNVQLERNVFLVHKEYDWLGCSPDGLYPDHTQGVEVKCRALYKNYRMAKQMAEHFASVNPLRAVEPGYRFQVQGAMWVTGLEHWWYVNYYEGEDLNGVPQRKLHRVEIPRDQELIDEMELRCMAFMSECYEIAGLEI